MGKHPWEDSRLMRAARRQPVDRVPVWLMRQAGRYLPEYQRIRSKVGFAELCRRPDLCAEVMVSTVERLGVDAAILFSDLLLILNTRRAGRQFAIPSGNPVRWTGLRNWKMWAGWITCWKQWPRRGGHWPTSCR